MSSNDYPVPFNPNQNLKAFQSAGCASAEEFYSRDRGEAWSAEVAIEVVPVQHRLPCSMIKIMNAAEHAAMLGKESPSPNTAGEPRHVADQQFDQRCTGHFDFDGTTRVSGPFADIVEYRHRCSGCGTGTWLLRTFPWMSYTERTSVPVLLAPGDAALVVDAADLPCEVAAVREYIAEHRPLLVDSGVGRGIPRQIPFAELERTYMEAINAGGTYEDGSKPTPSQLKAAQKWLAEHPMGPASLST